MKQIQEMLSLYLQCNKVILSVQGQRRLTDCCSTAVWLLYQTELIKKSRLSSAAEVNKGTVNKTTVPNFDLFNRSKRYNEVILLPFIFTH